MITVARAMVLEKFKEPLVMREVQVESLDEGTVLVRLTASGVCGSDLHTCEGKDPRTRLPIVIGHEGVGIVEKVRGRVVDMDGHLLEEGDAIIWDRGLSCGICRECTVKRRQALCKSRKAYGVHFGFNEPPHLNGCYASHIILRPGTKVIKLKSRGAEGIDPAVLVAASCSGATAAHAVEMANISIGDTVVVFGPGPLGAFLTGFAKARGARDVIVIGGTGLRLDICRELGANHTINRGQTKAKQRLEVVMDITGGRGAEVIFDAAGHHEIVTEALGMVATGGTVSLPGFGVPAGKMEIDIFSSLVRPTVNLQGSWVSDTRHLDQAFSLVAANPLPYSKLVTHRFKLEQANEALAAIRDRLAVKAVIQN